MHYIGNNNFKKSISLYLKKYKYKNTITSMLWECFDEVTKLKISILMNEWINFSGHPLLSIDIISKNNKYYFKLSQKSMLEDNETIWKIPVFMKSKHFEICRLVETRDYEISFEELNLNYDEIVKGNNFVVFNNDLKGFYRVKYNNEYLLNSILINYKKSIKNLNGDKIITSQEEKENYVSDYDLYGLLSYEMKCKNFESIKKILTQIKYIENSNLLLSFTKDIYNYFKSSFYPLEGFEEYIDDEKEKINLINQIKEYDDFFKSLVNNDKDKLLSLANKFYINEENKNMYRNQFNDEYDSLYLYFKCIIDNNEEIAKKLFVPNMDKNFEFLNKNLKYTLIEMIMKYMYLIKDKNEQIKIIDLIIKDYSLNYYSSSLNIRTLYQKSICNFASCYNSSFSYIYDNLLKNSKIFKKSKDIYLNGKGNRKKLFDFLSDCVHKIYDENKENKTKYGSIYSYFSSNECCEYFYFLKTIWFDKINDSALITKTLVNYFKDKFKSENESEDKLINFIKEVSED